MHHKYVNVYILRAVMVTLCVIPAGLPWFEATLDCYRLFGTEAAKVCIIVTDITLLTFLHNLVSTDGLIADWQKKKSYVHTSKHADTNTHNPLKIKAFVIIYNHIHTV